MPMRRLLLSAVLLLAGCVGPDESAVRDEFLRAAPGAEVVSLGTGDGDGDHVYYHVRYRLPPDTAVREAVWGYRRGPGGEWTRFSGEPPARTAPPPPGPQGDPTPDPPTEGPPPLSGEGWGPLRIGMTRAQVVAAAGEDANPGAVGGPDPERCDEFHPRGAPEGMRVMVEEGRLTRISLSDGARVRTREGVGVGSTAAEVRRAYGDRAGSTPHAYWPAPAEYLTVWETPPDGPGARGIVFEVDADGRVAHVHAGSGSIRYVEGCV